MNSIKQSDIAKELGLDQSTVSLALRGSPKIPVGTRQKILETAKRIGYHPDAFASGLASRKKKKGELKANLATVVGTKTENPLHSVRLVKNVYKAIQARAEQLGYGMEAFWRYAPENETIKIVRTFNSRNIQGVILLAIHESEINLVWENYAVAYANKPILNRPSEKSISFSRSSTNFFDETIRLLAKLKKRGYKSPGLLISRWRYEQSWGKYKYAFQEFYRLNSLFAKPPLLFMEDISKEGIDLRSWIKSNGVDCVVTPCYAEDVHSRTVKAGFKIPEDLGLAVISLNEQNSKYTGFCDAAEKLGIAAVDLVVGALNRGETGIPDVPKCVILNNIWNEGSTAPGK